MERKVYGYARVSAKDQSLDRQMKISQAPMRMRTTTWQKKDNLSKTSLTAKARISKVPKTRRL